MRIADRIAASMRKHEVDTVMWGDGLLVDATHAHLRLQFPHPLNCMTAACDAMDRAPDLFEKRRMHGHDSRGRPRVVRGYRLRTEDNP